ncbi:MAG TPA: serine/threonine-protein kinase [Polyangiaceae bacterium]|nr:serine/threonine-protein kinase [Polyangiaceae bacterium]
MIHSVQAGDVLAGKYRVDRVLGAGGMGMVVAARHLDLNKLVALKFMLSSAAQNPEAAHRFVQEARSAAQLRSEHVAHVSDYGTLETGEPYIVIEYLEGEDLGELLTRSGPLAVGFAVELMQQACEAMEEAHANGIIHRDIKPQNMFLTKRRKGTPCLKVLDFGLSKVALTGEAPAGLHQTNTAALLGSPLYMSPEQMRSARGVDHRADIWSLGATLYELLVGQPPFPAESLMELCVKLSNERPRPLRELRPDIPPGLEWAVLRCLEADPKARFQSVAEFSAALTPFAGNAAASAVAYGASPPAAAPQTPAAAVSNDRFANTGNDAPATGSAQLAPSGSANWGATQGPNAKRSRSLLPVGVALGAVALGAVGWLLRGGAGSEAAPEPSANAAVSAPAVAAAPAVAPTPAAPEPAAALAPSASTQPAATPAPSASTAPAPAAAKTVAAKPRGAAPSPAPAPAAATPRPAAAPAKNDTVQEDPWSRK